MRVIIIGGGVIGLSSAYYLSKAGYEVTILDKGKSTNNCSFGNAGYISPSHFIPLASPGIVAQGMKWMMSDTSPFYIKPRLSASLIKWGLKFWSKANQKTVDQNAPHLSNLLQLSRQLMIDMDNDLNGGFALEQKGCFMLYKTKETAHHEAEMAKEAKAFGIDAPIMSKGDIQALEPDVTLDILGGVYFPIDCHLHPARMMETLQSYLSHRGVQIEYETEVKDFDITNGSVTSVITNKATYQTDQLIVAAGSWLPIITQKLGISLLLQAGKGYSTTYTDMKSNLRHPAILVDDRVAVTPLGSELRIGGTMELTGINDSIDMKRVKPIVEATNAYFTNLNLPVPDIKKVWTGLRPCTPDGLPYLGKDKQYSNVIVAGGHAMLGISMAAATGLLVQQLVSNTKTEIDLSAFRLDR